MEVKRELRIFEILTDLQRIRIVLLLKQRKLCVCELQSILGLSAPTVSKHLTIMKDLGILSSEKSGKWVNYFIDFENLHSFTRKLIGFIEDNFSDADIFRKDSEKVEKVDRNLICM